MNIFILQINGVNVESSSHDEVISLLKGLGLEDGEGLDESDGQTCTTSLSVRHFRPASFFLNKSEPFSHYMYLESFFTVMVCPFKEQKYQLQSCRM